MTHHKLNLAHLMHLSQYADALARGFCELVRQQRPPVPKNIHEATADAISRLLSTVKQVDVAVQLCHESPRRPKPHVIENVLHMITMVEQDLNVIMRTLGANGGPTALVSYERIAA